MNDRIINMIFNMIGDTGKINLDEFVLSCNKSEFLDIDLESFRYKLNNESIKSLEDYSGLQARYINSYLRKGWNYEDLGIINNNKKLEMDKDIDIISNTIKELNPINKKFKTYRGVTKDYFGVSSLEELMLLKNRYFYDRGFVSTSIKKDTSFFNKEILNGDVCDIEITYLIDGNYSDGVYLGNISTSPEQNEYLLNKGSLFNIVDVLVEGNRAYITMVLIPNLYLESLVNKKDIVR